ncbi:glycosyltransferase family 4 protein [Paraburkholderia dipogonis]|uniref:glycosyltransferase family 4 protein n=1 Tax=Paraburkholderia dipogonis TaxID=1211383 RepID=UPI0035EA7CA8
MAWDAQLFSQANDVAAPDIGMHPKQIVQLGRYIEGKSQLDTIRAFERVLQSEPEARLLFCGVVEDLDYHRAVLSLVRQLGLESRVTVGGPRSDVAAILRASRVFAMPSRFEAQSIGFLEALASGIPVVASRIPSFGFASAFAGVSLVDTTDAEAYGRALLHALDTPRAKPAAGRLHAARHGGSLHDDRAEVRSPAAGFGLTPVGPAGFA